MSSVATSPTSSTPRGVSFATQARSTPKDLDRSNRAKAAYVHRPAGAPKKWDRSPAAIRSVTPIGYRPARNGGKWLGHVKDNASLGRMYRTRYEKTMHLARVMQDKHQRTTSTLCMSYQRLANLTGYSRDFIKRTIRLFKEERLIALVASGRSPHKDSDGNEVDALAPVYAFLTPLPQNTGESSAVDEIAPPSSFSLSIKSFKRPWKELTTAERCQRAFANRTKDPKTQWWPKHNPAPDAETTDHRELTEVTHRMALTIQREALELRKMTMKSLAAMLKPYFEAHWTVADVLIALEQRPDGTAWDTNGAGGMRSIRAWIRTRLNPWTSTHGPIEPASTQAQRRWEQQKQQQQKDAQEAAQRRQRASASKDSPARIKARRMAAILRCGSEQAARHQHPELFEAAEQAATRPRERRTNVN